MANPSPSRSWLRGTWAVLQKDLRLEMRSRYALNMLLLFVVSSLFLVAFALGSEGLTERLQVALLWIVILFAAAIGLGRAFVAEEEQGTVLLLQLNVPGSQVLAGKLLFNFLLLLAVEVVGLASFALLLNMTVLDFWLMAGVLALGAAGLAGATTLLAAIIARASGKGPLLPVLLFPLLVPLLLSVVNAGREALGGGGGWAAATPELWTLFGFSGVMITAAFMLFEYVWNE